MGDDQLILTSDSVTISVVGETGSPVRLTLRKGSGRVHLWTHGRQVASVSCRTLADWLGRRAGRPLVDDGLRLSASDLDDVYLEVYPHVAPSLVERRALDHLRQIVI